MPSLSISVMMREIVRRSFVLAPVVLGSLVADDPLQSCELHAPRPVIDRLLVRTPGRGKCAGKAW